MAKVTYKRKPDVCRDLKLVRKRTTDLIYRERKKSNTDPERLNELLRKRAEINHKLYKCSDQYDDLMRKKKALKQRVYRRSVKIKEVELTSTERAKIQKEAQLYQQAIADIEDVIQITGEKIADKELPSIKKDRFKFDSEDGVIELAEPIWIAREMTEGAILMYGLKTVVINGQKVNVSDRLSLESAYSEFESNVTKIRSQISTPYATLRINLSDKTGVLDSFYSNI